VGRLTIEVQEHDQGSFDVRELKIIDGWGERFITLEGLDGLPKILQLRRMHLNDLRNPEKT